MSNKNVYSDAWFRALSDELKRINNKPTRAALINKLRKDMKNKKKMRGFTLERQKAILKKFNALSRY